MKRKILAVLVIAVMLMGCLAGCGSSDSSSGSSSSSSSSGAVNYDDDFGENVLRIVTDSEYSTCDIRQTSSDYTIPMNIYDTLIIMEADSTGETIMRPGVAEEWSVSDDGLTYSFKLREGVMYTNGEEMTADDILYSVDSMLDPERACINTVWMDMLAGASDVLNGNADTVEGKGVIIYDDYNFDLVLEEPYSAFLYTLTTPAWSILNREAGDAGDEAGGGKTTSYFGTEPEYTIGSGPFIMTEWILNDHIYLEANQDYWQGAPSIDGILITVIGDAETEKMMFESGQTDIFDLDNAKYVIQEYESDPEMSQKLVYANCLKVRYLSINEAIEPFDNVLVRQALQRAIDKQTILDTLYYGAGELASGIFPPGMLCYNEDLPSIDYDPDAAMELLVEAGYDADDDEKFTMTLSMTNDDGQTDIELMQIVQSNLADLGIVAEIEQMDEATWYDVRAQGELGMYVTAWTADYNDPDNFIYTFFSPEATVSRSFNYYNTEAMGRIVAARTILDEDERMEEYKELEKIVIQDDAAWIPLFYQQKVRAVQDRVQNFIPHYAGYGACCYYGVSLDLSDDE